MVFEPALVKIEPGDTVKFVATDKGHNAESIKGMLPADATPFVGKNNEDVTVTFDKPGAYGVKCLPHYGMGMVALIVVGTPDNLAEAKAVPQVGQGQTGFRDAVREACRRRPPRRSEVRRRGAVMTGGLAPPRLSGLAAACERLSPVLPARLDLCRSGDPGLVAGVLWRD